MSQGVAAAILERALPVCNTSGHDTEKYWKEYN